MAEIYRMANYLYNIINFDMIFEQRGQICHYTD